MKIFGIPRTEFLDGILEFLERNLEFLGKILEFLRIKSRISSIKKDKNDI